MLHRLFLHCSSFLFSFNFSSNPFTVLRLQQAGVLNLKKKKSDGRVYSRADKKCSESLFWIK
jgi:hypothetical protein